MAQLTVRDIEDDIKVRLKRRAVRHGTSMEAEARQILRNALKDDELRAGPGLGSRMGSSSFLVERHILSLPGQMRTDDAAGA